MDTLRKYRWILYIACFIFIFIVGAYCSFPKNAVKESSEALLTRALYRVGPSLRGTPEVTIKKASLWRISGIKAEGIKAFWPEYNGQKSITINFDRLAARVGLFSLFSSSKSFSAKSNLYDGSLDASASINKKNQLKNIYVKITSLNTQKMDFLTNFIGINFGGILNAETNLSSSSNLLKDGNGKLTLSWKNWEIMPGMLNIPSSMLPGISLPNTSLGQLDGVFSLTPREFSSQSFSFSGGDIEGDLEIKISLAEEVSQGKLDGKGWFKMKPEYVEANNTIKVLYDIIPQLKSAKAGDGKVPFAISGSLGRPNFYLSNSGL